MQTNTQGFLGRLLYAFSPNKVEKLRIFGRRCIMLCILIVGSCVALRIKIGTRRMACNEIKYLVAWLLTCWLENAIIELK